MNSLKVRNIFAFALCLIACACAKAEWNGTYFCELEFGSTVPEQAVIVEHELELSKNACTLIVTGYQASENIVCEAQVSGNTAAIKFVSYENGSLKNAYDVQIYNAGETLFELTGDPAKPVTEWKSMWSEDVPTEGNNCFARQGE